MRPARAFLALRDWLVFFLYGRSSATVYLIFGFLFALFVFAVFAVEQFDFSAVENYEAVAYSIDKISVMRHRNERALIGAKQFFKRFLPHDVHMVGGLVEYENIGFFA